MLFLRYLDSDQLPSDATATGGTFTSRDLADNVVQWDVPPDIEGSAAEPTGGSLEAPEQGLAVPLLSATMTGGIINPPTMTDAFVYRDYGQPDDPGSGLVLVPLHAVRNGMAPGNLLAEVPDGGDPRVLIDEGDPLVVDGQAYEVTDVAVVTKGEATSDDRIWADWQERDEELVIITCLQRPGSVGSATENVVVFAERAD